MNLSLRSILVTILSTQVQALAMSYVLEIITQAGSLLPLSCEADSSTFSSLTRCVGEEARYRALLRSPGGVVPL